MDSTTNEMEGAKASFCQTVDFKAKQGFEKASVAVYGKDRTTVRLFNEVGNRLREDLEALQKKHGGKLPDGVKLICRLVEN